MNVLIQPWAGWPEGTSVGVAGEGAALTVDPVRLQALLAKGLAAPKAAAAATVKKGGKGGH